MRKFKTNLFELTENIYDISTKTYTNIKFVKKIYASWHNQSYKFVGYETNEGRKVWMWNQNYACFDKNYTSIISNRMTLNKGFYIGPGEIKLFKGFIENPKLVYKNGSEFILKEIEEGFYFSQNMITFIKKYATIIKQLYGCDIYSVDYSFKDRIRNLLNR